MVRRAFKAFCLLYKKIVIAQLQFFLTCLEATQNGSSFVSKAFLIAYMAIDSVFICSKHALFPH